MSVQPNLFAKLHDDDMESLQREREKLILEIELIKLRKEKKELIRETDMVDGLLAGFSNRISAQQLHE